jgi:hypothetical protein
MSVVGLNIWLGGIGRGAEGGANFGRGALYGTGCGLYCGAASGLAQCFLTLLFELLYILFQRFSSRS